MRRPGHRAAIAAGIACVLLAGCSSGADPKAGPSRSTKPSSSASAPPTTSPTPTTKPTPTGPPVTLRQARREWNRALRTMTEDLTARYTWGAWVSGEEDPIVSESGVFGLDPMRMSFERVIRSPTAQGVESAEYTLRMRRREDEAYMQMADWGPWDGCWLHVTSDLVSEATGLELADSPALPVSVAVALDATVTKPTAEEWFGEPYTEYTGDVPAIEAIQFLGVSAKALLADQERLSGARVPILVAMLTGRVKGAAARGPDVVAALKRSHVRIDPRLRTYLSGVIASVSFSNLGTGAVVRLPAARRVLPDGATKNRTCPAKTPES